MEYTKKILSILMRGLIIGALTQLFSGSVLGQAPSAEIITDNAHLKGYGSGWECDFGYRERDGLCDAIAVPQNAYVNGRSFGQGWDCNHGYQLREVTCDPVLVPENAYLDASGDGWDCHRGYRKSGNKCFTIDAPKNGYLDSSSYGNGWKCNRGYVTSGNHCIKVEFLKTGIWMTTAFARDGHVTMVSRAWEMSAWF